MMRKVVLIFSVFFGGVYLAESARILGVVLFSTHSHNAPVKAIWQKLIDRGHEVVSITSSPISSNSSIKNLTEIDCPFAREMWTIKGDMKPSITSLITAIYKILQKISELIFQLPEVQQLLNEEFDLVVVEWVYPAVFAFSAHFSCPLIGISTLEMLDVLSYDMGNPIYPVVHPNFFIPANHNNQPGLFERIHRLHGSIWLRWFYQYKVYPKSDQIIKKYLGNNLPPVIEIISNVSAVFVNNNFLFGKPRPYLPNIVEYTGIHVTDPKPLPKVCTNYLIFFFTQNLILYFNIQKLFIFIILIYREV